MKRTSFLLLIIFCLFSKPIKCQSFSDKLFFTIQPEYATLVAHHEELKSLSLYNFPNLELNFYQQSTGSEEWEKRWNYPQSGVSLYYSSLSNKSVFGQAFAIMPFESFTFFRHKKHEQRLMIAFGLGYLTRPYDKVTNPENIAIGSHFNVSVKFQYSFLYRFTPNFGLSLGTSFGHFSNGATKYPNWGINVWSFSLGAHLKFNKTPISLSEPKINPFQKQWIPYVWGAWGVKQNSESDPNLYNATSFGGGIAKNYSYGKEWMIGTDFFWDYTDKVEFAHKGLYPTDIELLKWGLYAGHEWSLNRFSATFQTGVYLIAYQHNRTMGPIYSRVAFRYRLMGNLYGNISIKSHFAKADYIEWGILYKFRRK